MLLFIHFTINSRILKCFLIGTKEIIIILTSKRNTFIYVTKDQLDRLQILNSYKLSSILIDIIFFNSGIIYMN